MDDVSQGKDDDGNGADESSMSGRPSQTPRPGAQRSEDDQPSERNEKGSNSLPGEAEGEPPTEGKADKASLNRPTPRRTLELIGYFAAILGILSSILQAFVTLGSGQFFTFYTAILLTALIVVGIMGSLARRGRHAGSQPASGANLLLVAIFFVLSMTLVGNAGVALGWSLGKYNPVPEVLYLSYSSTNTDDVELGWPVVLRPVGEPPENEYKVKSTLGYGNSVKANKVPGTHLVYDIFCTDETVEKPCGGMVRSHYYSKNDKAVVESWDKAPNEVRPVAVLSLKRRTAHALKTTIEQSIDSRRSQTMVLRSSISEPRNPSVMAGKEQRC